MIGLVLSLIGGKIGALWAMVRANPLPALCAILALWGAYERHQHHSWRDYAKRMESASKAATAAQIAANHEPARKSAIIAERSNHEAPAYYGTVRRAADAYRMRPEASCPVAASLPGTDHTAPVNDGPGQSASVVTVSREDFDTLTANSGRLAKVRQDAIALIDAGVAVGD